MVERPAKEKCWTLEEIERLVDLGAFDRPNQYEFVGGRIVEKAPISDRHWFADVFLARAIREIFGIEAAILQRFSLKLSEHDAPEPDLAILARATPRPCSSDVLLVAEVADLSRGFDLGEKAAVYAAHSVPDYWVVDLPRRRIVVHRTPNPVTRDWGEVRSYGEGEEIALLARPEATVSVAEVLRPGEP